MSVERGRLAWAGVGFVVTTALLLLLRLWFPVSIWVVMGWAALLFIEWLLPTGRWQPQAALYHAGFVLVFVGSGLLLGSWEGMPPPEYAVAGGVLGLALLVVGVCDAVVAQRRFSARAVADEIERERERERQRDGALGRDRDR